MSQFLAICRRDLLICAVMGWTGDGQPKRAWPTFLALLGEIESVLLSLQDSTFISSGNKHIWELSLGAYVGHSLKGTPYGMRVYISTLGRAVDNTQWISLRLSCIILFKEGLW